MSKRITIEDIRSGQPRPYADSVDEFVISFELRNKDKEWVPFDVAENHFDEFARSQGHQFYTKADTRDWAAPVLERKTKESAGVWRYVIRRAFTG